MNDTTTNTTTTTDIPSFATIRIDVDDAIELSEVLGFVSDWLTNARGVVGDDFERFVGSHRYPMADLASDLSRWSTRLLANRIELAR